MTAHDFRLRARDVARARALPAWTSHALSLVVWRLTNRGLGNPYPAFLSEGPWVAAVITALVGVRLVSLDMTRPAPRKRSRDATRWMLALGAVGALVVIAFWHLRFVRDVRALPIASDVADMLPLMRAGFADLDAGASPFRPHLVPWELKNYFLPSTFLPYYAVSKLGVDIRWTTVGSLDALFAVLALLVPIGRGVASLLRGSATWLVVVTVLGVFLVAGNHFAGFVQLGPYWLYVTVAFVALVRGWKMLCACALGLVLAAREPGVFVAALPLIHLARTDGGRLRFPLVALAIAAALFAPFFLHDALFMAGNIAQYSSFDVPDSITRHVGLAGILHALGVPQLRWPLLALLAGCVFIAARGRTSDALFVTRASGVLGVLFVLCAPIAWEWAFVEGLAVLGVHALALERWLAHDDDDGGRARSSA